MNVENNTIDEDELKPENELASWSDGFDGKYRLYRLSNDEILYTHWTQPHTKPNEWHFNHKKSGDLVVTNVEFDGYGDYTEDEIEEECEWMEYEFEYLTKGGEYPVYRMDLISHDDDFRFTFEVEFEGRADVWNVTCEIR